MKNFKKLLLILLLGLAPLNNILPAAQPDAVEQAATLQCALCTYPNPTTAHACEVCGEQISQNNEVKDANAHEVKMHGEKELCTICRDDESEEPIVVLHHAHKGANHSFHRTCIIPHLSEKLDCPLCRKSFTIDELETSIDQLTLNTDEITTITNSLAENARLKDEQRAQQDRDELLEDQILDAAANGDLPALIEALTQGANSNSADVEGNTPLHFACRNGHLEVIQILLNHPDIDSERKNLDDDTPFLNAVAFNQTASMQLLLLHNPNTIQSLSSMRISNSDEKILTMNALHVGSFHNAQEALLLLLTLGLTSNPRTSRNETPLHIATRNKHGEIVKILLKQDDIEVDALDCNALTPFICAVMKNDIEIMDVLRSHGAQLNATGLIKSKISGESIFNNNAFHYAVITKSKDALLKLIEYSELKNAPLLNAKNDADKTPLDYASQLDLQDFVAILQEAEAIEELKNIWRGS